MNQGRREPAERLPDSLLEQLDALETAGLRAVRRYVAHRIETDRQPIADRIVEEATGEIIDIDDHGPYAIVRMRSPVQPEENTDSPLVSLYHVRREKRFDDSDALNWSFLIDTREGGKLECHHCGASIDRTASTCAHCGASTPDRDHWRNQ
ncbi:hypothetical protein C479_13248 [Halovivax asiaticus JCM 14624]|uniref:Zinc-ribbon domain-containing protein n=1 Tax=Halovivax asiaticus JCM 14624 TaxID=1227490 RepID=M0BCV7_9EURY|nr:zinc ribbon domain-containing protein [Halovivax asiaticus]ELZ08307.1 hypothetical protein C479_13248 [Halovivax asiaticus JCM 14624]